MLPMRVACELWEIHMDARGAERARVLELLRGRARRHRMMAILCVATIIAGLAVVGVRAHALAEEFPNPEHVSFQAGETIPYDAYEGVSLSAAPAVFLSDDEVRTLCPEVYGEYEHEDGRYRIVRVDVTVHNNGDREIELFDLHSSALVLGAVYGNQSFMPAEAEAFPDIDYSMLGSGASVTMPYLYMIWDYTLPAGDWEKLEQMPIQLQFSNWPRVLSVDVGAHR